MNIKKQLLSEYFENWIKIYKEGSIREVTLSKYKLSLTWLKKIAPKIKVSSINRIE